MSAPIDTTTAIRQYRMLIDGEFKGSETMLPVLNPATEEVISEVPAATPGQVDEAVLVAQFDRFVEGLP